MKVSYTCEGIKRSKAAGEQPFDTTVNQAVWLACRTLGDFGNATADWLEGKIGHMPTAAWYESPNDESQLLLPYINPLNRSGSFASTHSQPAALPGNNPLNAMNEVQRATLSGFATYEMMRRLAASAGSTGLKVLVARPGSPARRSSVPITRAAGDDCTLTGNVESPEEIARSYGGYHTLVPGLHHEMICTLQESYQVDIVDMEYGNNDRLWPMLTALVSRYAIGG